MAPKRLAVGAFAWAAVGATVAVTALPGINHDARVLVATASLVFPMCAVGAGIALPRGALRSGGLLLIASVATPTYFAWPLNLPALVAGLVLVVSPASARSHAAGAR
jgi:hypothetical protein